MRALPLAALAALAFAATASAAPIPILTLTEPAAAWAGEHVVLGAVPGPVACTLLTCERFDFLVDLPPMPGQYPPLAASIAWESAKDDFDLYLYDGWSFLVVASISQGGTSESLLVEEIKPGQYTLLVVPVSVFDSGYDGRVELIVG